MSTTPVLVSAALLVATLALYAPVRRHAFVNYDDPEYVTENPHVTRGFTAEGVVWAFTESHSANWHPLTWLSHMADCELFGVVAGPQLMVNAVLHALSAVLLFLFLWRTTGALWCSAFVAAVFALHPLRVESVAWVSERKDALSAFLFMVALNAYAWYVVAPSPRRYLAVAGAFALGLLAKPMLVTLPFVLLLLDVWPLRRLLPGGPFRRVVVEKLPLLALSAAVSGVTFFVQRHAGAMIAFDRIGLDFRLPNAIRSYGLYLWDTVWPTGLAVFYPMRNPVPLGEVVLSAVVLTGISALVLSAWRNRPYLLVGWLWYLGMLVPVIGLVWVGEQARADRFTYLPQIGLAVMVAWGVRDLIGALPTLRWLAGAAAVACLGALTIVSSTQIAYWRDTMTLFEHALAVTEGNYVTHANLGAELAKLGRNGEAHVQYAEALRLQPVFPKAHLSLGALLLEEGKIDEAMPHLEYAIQNRPDAPTAHFNYGLAIAAQGRIDDAIGHYEEALRLDPVYPKPRVALAGLLEKRGRTAEAVEQLREAVSIKPDFVAAHVNLAILLERQGATAAALEHYGTAARLLPDDPRVHLNLAAVLEGTGARQDALVHYRTALRLAPDSAPAREGVARLDAPGGN